MSQQRQQAGGGRCSPALKKNQALETKSTHHFIILLLFSLLLFCSISSSRLTTEMTKKKCNQFCNHEFVASFTKNKSICFVCRHSHSFTSLRKCCSLTLQCQRLSGRPFLFCVEGWFSGLLPPDHLIELISPASHFCSSKASCSVAASANLFLAPPPCDICRFRLLDCSTFEQHPRPV